MDIMEDETHNNEYKKLRIEQLGFLPQKENCYNKLLPYSKHIDEESERLFATIKTNLVKSILTREIRPGSALWTSRLNKYIKLYGLKFSKENHIALIKLYYELITMPDLEPTRINKCGLTLSQLLKKKYLITPDELQLEWRPLYDLCVRTTEKSKNDIGMYRYFSSFESGLFQTIRACKIYFPASATQEILDELKPKLCPFNSLEIMKTFQYLELFLPIAVKHEEADISYNLWFKEFMDLWDICHNAGLWENNMMWILSGLVRFQIGYINWDPYVSKMFARFLRSLQLPVAFKQKMIGKQFKIDSGAMAIWIVCTLHGDETKTFFHLEKLMQTLESYFYSANAGRWTARLRELLRKLAFFFVQRIHWERYKTPSWDNNVPEHFKLSDTDIDRFVNILKPCVEAAIFSRTGMQEVGFIISYLASLRPHLIIPGILEKLYSSMDSLTEPHKLTCCMMSTIAVGRYMVQGKQNNYPEGPTHVIPLLLSLLPGIDPNDIKKTYVTFNFLINFLNMVPLIDSSKAYNSWNDLTEEEHMVCEATAEIEDFVLQLFDRIFNWIESNSVDFVRLEQIAMQSNNKKNISENLAEAAIYTVVLTILNQCSPAIYHSALRKCFNFISEKILEVQISGKIVATMARCFTIVDSHESLKLFLPYLLNSIEETLQENPTLGEEEHVDARFLYHLLILSELVDGQTELIQYLPKLMMILDKTLHMASIQVHLVSSRMLELILYSLSYMKPKEYRSLNTDYSTPLEEFLSIREWGKPHKIKDLQINWYVPKEREIEAVQMLIEKYLEPELKKLNDYSDGTLKLTRHQLKCTLKIVHSSLSCHLLLPMWDEPVYEIQQQDSTVVSWPFNLIVTENNGQVSMQNGDNIRKTIVQCLDRVQKKILHEDDGDTQSLQQIINIYNLIVFNKTANHDFETHWKNFHMVKRLLEDRLHQEKLHLRHVHIDRVMLQQEFRIESRNFSFTATHKRILENLIDLSVSRYSEVRIAAQCRLAHLVQSFPLCYTLLTTKLKEFLQLNSIENHETFKGCLYILVGPKTSPIIARHNWEFIKEIWPLLVRSMPSEKPSIVNLIAALTESVNQFFPTITIELTVPERTIQAAVELGKVSSFPCDFSAFPDAIDTAEQKLMQKNCERKLAYEELVDNLMYSLEQGNLHWRYHNMAMTFLKDLVHSDVKYNARVVRFFLKSTIHESLSIRKIAIKVLTFISVQQKPKFKKYAINSAEFQQGNVHLSPGERPDNKWLLYDQNTVPKSETEWEQFRFVHDQITGYYGWPKTVHFYAPPSQQISLINRLETMSETEQELYNFFQNSVNISEMVKYFSLEERKGVDQFNIFRFLMLKNVFKMFEDQFLDLFIGHIEKLVQDKQESSQRCAAELISAIIRGSKHWSFSKLENLWKLLLPIINNAITNMGNETLADWTICFTTSLESRDPNFYHWLMEYLIEDPIPDGISSFISCNRLQILMTVISQQSWRNVHIFNRLLEYFNTKHHLMHPFQNIRDKISSFLSIFYGKDLNFSNNNGNETYYCGPKTEELFHEILPKLNRIYDFLIKNQEDLNSEKDDILKLFKIVARYATTSMVRVNYSAKAEFWSLLPLGTILQNYENDEEISSLATNLLVALGQTMTVETYIPNAISVIRETSQFTLWSSRALIAEFLPVFIMNNMPIIQSNSQWVYQIQDLVLKLLEDSQLEVRIEAAKVLSGLLHCQFILNPTDLLEVFKQKARSKKLKKKDDNYAETLISRHTAVLGLCSFISAHPYNVPDYLPAVFEALGSHLGDPPPIPATIRKTMGDFKRTHHDNWEIHKLKFTDDELSILSDLSVPPSYYV